MNDCACNSGLGDVSIVGGRVIDGSVIEWKGQILWPDADETISWHADAEARIKNVLWAHGGFSQVDAGQMGSFWNSYISIRVRTKVEFAYLGDVFNTIEGAVWQAGYRPRLESFEVVSVPAGTPQIPAISLPGRAGGVTPPPPSAGGWDWPNIFGGSGSSGGSENPIDLLARWLGVSPTQAAVIGAGAALAGIVVIKRLL